MKRKTKYIIPLIAISLCSCRGISNGDTTESSYESDTATEARSDSSASETTESTSESGYKKIKANYDVSDFAIASDYPYTPAKGDVKLLCIPVLVKDYSKYATEDIRQDINDMLFGNKNQTGWESVSSFYKESSYGKLNITGTVSDWYDPNLTAAQIAKKDEASEYTYTGELLDDAIAWYKKKYNTDMKEFDNNSDGYIDGVFLVYSAPDYTYDDSLSSSTFWAFTSWTNSKGNTSSPVGCTYFWASYDFMYEGYEDELDSHTFVHETGHMLGLDDYYSYNTLSKDDYMGPSPAGNITMMDANVTDLDCYSKFSLGWTEPYLIDKEGELTISLSSENGDSIIIPAKGATVNNAYDEYAILELFGPEGLSEKDLKEGYSYNLSSGKITDDGIRMYHIDSRLCTYDSTGKNIVYSSDPTEYKNSNYGYARAHTNTPSGYYDGEKSESYNYLNDKYRLIQVISNEGKNYASSYYTLNDKTLFHAGDKFDNSSSTFTNQFVNKTKLNTGKELAYDFEVLSIESGKATIRFTAN